MLECVVGIDIHLTPSDVAQRRRTQIRMAQRAYRHRKESTISSLEKKVQGLTANNEEMSSIFINLYDFAVSKGLLQREPEFGQQLQASTEKFLALAKASADEGDDQNLEDSPKTDEPDGRRSNSQNGSYSRNQEIPLPVSEPLVPEPTPTYGGYVLTKDETPDMDMTYSHDDQYRDNQYKADRYRARSSDIQIITRPTEDNASFPFDFMGLQQYRVDVPEIEEYSQHFLPQAQPLLPKSFAHSELSFSRRIHRLAIEKAFRLITSDDPAAQAAVQHVFRFSLMFNSKKDILAKFNRIIRASEKESLENWHAPFVNIGGAGTHYPLSELEANWELRPKFGTGYSMGPFTTTVTGAQGYLDDNMKINMPGLEGYFFDTNDVEGYLRGRGIDIAPAVDFVDIELDRLGISDPSSPQSTTSSSVLSKNSPETPKSTVEVTGKASDAIHLVDDSLKGADPMSQYLPFPLAFASWDNVWPVKDSGDTLKSHSKWDQNTKNRLSEISSNTPRNNNRRTVTISVNFLIDGTSLIVPVLHIC